MDQSQLNWIGTSPTSSGASPTMSCMIFMYGAGMRSEVMPHAQNAWSDERSINVSYEVSFNRYSCKREPFRSLKEIGTEIPALERDTERLLVEIIEGETP